MRLISAGNRENPATLPRKMAKQNGEASTQGTRGGAATQRRGTGEPERRRIAMVLTLRVTRNTKTPPTRHDAPNQRQGPGMATAMLE
uniref:Uncharacterized protein n=1 Tax=Physcomitrium patens TaxID=3218 RepID=A0A7I3Z0I5_PHYPA